MTPSIVFTVDTEPDDQWAPPMPDGTLPPFTFANTRGLGKLRDFFRERDAPVTWMTSYSVARDEMSARLLRACAHDGDEIAGHLHGWETPPYAEFDRVARPFIGEYAAGLRMAKHHSLLAAHKDAFDARPVSYRAGRWGVDAIELEQIAELGYTIDSSIPHQPGPDFRSHLAAAPRPHLVGTLWEVPASIAPIGFLGRAIGIARVAARRNAHAEIPRALSNVLAAARAQELIWVRPLKHPRAKIVRATEELLRRGAPIINVMFHSSEAFVGTSPLSRRQEDVERLYGDLDAILVTARANGAVARTLRDAVTEFAASS
jgi:hypothetical protein